MFGTDPMTPEMEEGIRIAKQEMPNMPDPQSYGFFSRLLNPNAMAYVSPGSNIYMNPRTNEGQTPQEIADTLTHEMEHVKQNKSEGYGPTMQFLRDVLIPQGEPYHRRPDEMAAFQAEKLRRSRMGRMQTAVPSFSTGEFYVPQDINLPAPQRQNILTPRQYSGPVTMK